MMNRDRETELVDALLHACEAGSEAIREAGYAAQSCTDFALAATRDAQARYVVACTSFRVSVTLAALALRDLWPSSEPPPELIHRLPELRALLAATASVDPGALRTELGVVSAQVQQTSERLRAVTDNDGANALAEDLSTDLATLETTCGPIVKAAVELWSAQQERVVQAQLDRFSAGHG